MLRNRHIPNPLAFRNPVMPTAMAEYRIVRSGCLWRFEHHHGQRRSDFRGPVFVPKHRGSRRLPCLAVQIGREALQNGRSWVHRERDWHRVWQTGDLEHGRVGDAYRRSGFVRYRPMLPRGLFRCPMVWNSSRPPASNHAMWNMHNWDSTTADAYRLTVVARTAAFLPRR